MGGLLWVVGRAWGRRVGPVADQMQKLTNIRGTTCNPLTSPEIKAYPPQRGRYGYTHPGNFRIRSPM